MKKFFVIYRYETDDDFSKRAECASGRFVFNPDRSFEERCEIVRRTSITSAMTYEQRLAALRRRFGL